MPLDHLLLSVVFAFVAGLFGALLGIGGGLFLTPLLVGVLSVPIHTAIAASIVAVIATSSSGGSAYVRRRIVNLKLGMVMETVTVLGAILGGVTAINADPRVLYTIFGLVLLYSGGYMALRPGAKGDVGTEGRGPGDRSLEARLGLDGAFLDGAVGKVVTYTVRRLPAGMGVALVAGYISGTLGVGGGLFKVPAMTTMMGVPLKAATATSTFMIGVTGVASAYIYYARGAVDPLLTVPVVIGVFSGASLSPRIANRLPTAAIRRLFIGVLLVFAAEMLARAVGILR